MPRNHRTGHNSVGGLRLQSHVSQRERVHWQARLGFPQGCGFIAEHGLRRLGFAQCIFDVSTHVRHHYAGADRWRDR